MRRQLTRSRRDTRPDSGGRSPTSACPGAWGDDEQSAPLLPTELPSDPTPSQILKETFRLELNKSLEAARDPNQRMSLKEVQKLATTLQEFEESNPKKTVDLSTLTDEELNVVAWARTILKKVLK